MNLAILYSQEKDSYQLKDSVVIVGEKYYTENINKQLISICEVQSRGVPNYDLMDYLKILGINYSSDFNILPSTEGADYYEQQFFVNNFQVPFQSRLIGLNSGLNSLLIAKMSLLESHSIFNSSHPVKYRIVTRKPDTSQIQFNSNNSLLCTENTLSIPLKILNGGLLLGYNRSLLETIRPLLNKYYDNSEFDFNKFPFYQGCQIIGNFSTGKINVSPLFFYSEDEGIVDISSKTFNFKSDQLNYGVEINYDGNDIINSTRLFSSKGKNNINYAFLESANGKLDGSAVLSFYNIRANSDFEIKLNQHNSLNIDLGYNYQKANSDNEASMKTNSKSAFYTLDVYDAKIFYTTYLSDKFASTINFGVRSIDLNIPYPSYGLDLLFSEPALISARFQLSYDNNQEPVNSIYYSFQNTIWDPSSSGNYYFIDKEDNPIKPVKCFNISLNVMKNISAAVIESDLSIKLYYRQLKNLIYANNFPDEITIYNSDLKFNQNFEGIRYGISLSLTNKAEKLSISNITSFNICISSTKDRNNNILFNSLNHNPITFSNLTQYEFKDFYLNVFFFYSSGRYIFKKLSESFYSSIDSSYSYSLGTDYDNQINLKSYARCDVSVMYKFIMGSFNMNFGVSVFNIFNNKNESGREFSINNKNGNIISESKYFNLPTFISMGININYIL